MYAYSELYLNDAKQNLAVFLIIWSVLVVLMAIFAQDCSSNQVMRTNLSVAILLSSQECPALNWQEGFWNTHIPTNNFLQVYFHRNVPQNTELDGLWQSINGSPANALKVFFPEFHFQRSELCTGFTTKWISAIL